MKMSDKYNFLQKLKGIFFIFYLMVKVCNLIADILVAINSKLLRLKLQNEKQLIVFESGLISSDFKPKNSNFIESH